MTDTLRKIKLQTIAVRPTFKHHIDLFLKRAFDIFASFWGLIFLSPLFLLIAYSIKRESPGPTFYRGPRMGKNGKVFGILKFRTMYECPESYRGLSVTGQGDSRITPLGKWLRQTKLNELPQLWNVLVGEMSLVGPRPEDPEIAKTWPEAAGGEILSVPPGITSPASIIYRDEENMLGSASVMDDYLSFFLPDKLRLDQLYVRNHNLLSDLDVILWTLIVLLPRLRTQAIPTESLYNGYLSRFMSRYVSWLLVDSLVAFTAVGLAGVLWRLGGPLNLGLDRAIWTAAGMAVTFSFINYKMGLGRIAWRYAKPMYSFDLALSSGLSTLLLTVVDWALPGDLLLPLGLLINAGLLAFLGFVAIRYRERLLTGLASRWVVRRKREGHIGERVLIVGAGECGLLATWLLYRSKLSSAFSVIGMVDDDPTKQGMVIDGHQVFGLTRRIPEIVKTHDVGVILFAIESIPAEEQDRILELCRQTAARVIIIPDLLTQFRLGFTEPVRQERAF
jgi:lipopolysaccharide/colanic/teichoic acid biosynthesis glycosyltransferase